MALFRNKAFALTIYFDCQGKLMTDATALAIVIACIDFCLIYVGLAIQINWRYFCVQN